MPLDANYQPPSLHGLDLPQSTREAIIALQESIVDWARQVEERANDPAYIRIDGGRTLAEAMRTDRTYSGDLRLTVASRIDAHVRDGWVLCDGRNGTPDTIGAIVVGAAEARNPGVTIVGGSDTGQPVLGDTEEPDRLEVIWSGETACDSVWVAHEDHVHPMPHVHAVLGSLQSFTVVWMMKL